MEQKVQCWSRSIKQHKYSFCPVLLHEDKLTLLKRRSNRVWLNLTFVILSFSLPAELNLPFIWYNHSRNINKFPGKVYFKNPVACCLLVFSNSIAAFTFFVLFGCEKLYSAWSPPLQILPLRPWVSWWHHVEKSHIASQTAVWSNEYPLRIGSTRAGPQFFHCASTNLNTH